MPGMKLPFPLERNNGAAVTGLSEIDFTPIAGGEPVNAEEALRTIASNYIFTLYYTKSIGLLDKPCIIGKLENGIFSEYNVVSEEYTAITGDSAHYYVDRTQSPKKYYVYADGEYTETTPFEYDFPVTGAAMVCVALGDGFSPVFIRSEGGIGIGIIGIPTLSAHVGKVETDHFFSKVPIVECYYYNGALYEDDAHTIAITPVADTLYKTGNLHMYVSIDSTLFELNTTDKRKQYLYEAYDLINFGETLVRDIDSDDLWLSTWKFLGNTLSGIYTFCINKVMEQEDKKPSVLVQDAALGKSYTSMDNDTLGKLPSNSTHYGLGSISALNFSNNMEAMTLGCTVTFTASDDFTVSIPRTFTENNVTYTPKYAARTAGDESLTCVSGHEYMVTIMTVPDHSGNPVNVFSMTELYTPTSESNQQNV